MIEEKNKQITEITAQGKNQIKRLSALAKSGVLKIVYDDINALFNSYMPFVKGCGIFMPSKLEYELDTEVFIIVTLPDEEKSKFAVSAKVVWLNPKTKLGKRVPGIGLQILGSKARTMQQKIEDILGKRIKSPLPTSTI